MAQRTHSEETMTRAELASYLVEIADEFERGEEAVRIPVGNKSVALDPTDAIDTEVDVVERSSRLRGDRETIEIELSWKR